MNHAIYMFRELMLLLRFIQSPSREEFIMTRNLRERAFRIALMMAIAALPCAPLRASNPVVRNRFRLGHAGELDRGPEDPHGIQHLWQRQQLPV